MVRAYGKEEYFVDRDPTHFRHVLNWMRGVRFLPDEEMVLDELMWEADFYCLNDMKDAIAKHPVRYHMSKSLQRIADEVRTK